VGGIQLLCQPMTGTEYRYEEIRHGYGRQEYFELLDNET